ncbi:hypothetical protein I4U23_026646 [Adineta vaga]|nr:hypothetical protein I4U23_026646 [Adineta vaga]
MGCTQCMQQQEPVAIKPNQNGLKSLFYATNEFDLSRSDDEDEEEENYSLNSIKNSKPHLTNRVFSLSGWNLTRSISQREASINASNNQSVQ